MKRWSRAAALLASAGATFGVVRSAGAADCAFTGSNNVYVTGSSASQPVLGAIAGVLAKQSPPVNLVYVKSESCQGVQTFVNGTAVPAAATYWPNGGTAAATCNFAAGAAPLPDASASDVFASTCPNITLTSAMSEVQGPVQAMTFIVHPQSTQAAISAEAARVVMKDIAQAQYQVAPWNTAANIFIRPGGASGSGTRAMIGKAVGLADADWAAPLTVKTGSGDVLSAVGTSAAPGSSLGILSVTVADNNRPSSTSQTPVKVLAFQAKDGLCGYLPDSTSTSNDKLNVREGRYGIWGPIHFITATSGGKPTSTSTPGAGDAAVQAFVNAVTMSSTAGFSVDQKKAIIDATATGHVVPQCAMRVRRTQEVAAEASYQPDEPCGCYWESKANGAAPASCTACTDDTQCASGTNKTCRYGFCEAK